MIIIPILLILLVGYLKGKNLLFPVAIVSAIFPASSVMNLPSADGASIAPFWFIGLIIFLCAVLSLIPKYFRSSTQKLGAEQLLILLTFYWAITVSFVAPFLFRGIGVFSPRGGIDAQVNNLAHLNFGISNVAQIIYAIILVVFVSYASDRGRGALKWVKVALTIAVFFGVYQWLADRWQLPFPSGLIYTNQGITIANNQRIGEFLRINSTFAEPSTAGAFFVAGTVAMLAARSYLVAAFCGLGVLLSTSSTGYVALALMVAAFFVVRVYLSLKRRRFPVVLTSVAVLLVLSGAALIFLSGLGEIVLSFTVNKASSVSFANRTASDLYSLGLVLQTYGLGVGLGSNRPSSFLTYVLSNIGVVGLLLLAASLVLLFRRRGLLWARWGLLTYLVAKVLGVPDFNDPWLWIWFSLALAAPAAVPGRRPMLPAAWALPGEGRRHVRVYSK